MRDLRLPALGAMAWLGALAGPVVADAGSVVVRLLLIGAVALVGGVVVGVGRRRRATAVALVSVLVGAGVVAVLHAGAVSHNPVFALARRGAAVRITAVVSSDPRSVRGAHSTEQLVELQVHAMTARGSEYRMSVPVLGLGGGAWRSVPLGATISASGELVKADSADVAGLFLADDPTIVREPGPWWRLSARLRAAVRDAVADRPADQAALVPALVDGDDTALPDALSDDFRTTGLTHLLAVSGTNLTLVVGFLLLVARWCRVRGRGLYVVGAVGIRGFLILARAEPSVVRAAAMGAVGLLALGHNGRQRALRCLGASVVALLLVDPGLARSLGFALSVVATAGILLLAPPWRDALSRWLPRWAAEAIAVPAAAQLACTPLVASISGQVSLVAVAANLLAEPAVGPATVLGLLGGVLGLAWSALGQVAGRLASWCVAWIITVAERGARLPMAGIGWGTGPVALAALALVCGAIAVAAPRVLRHRLMGAASCLVLVGVAVVRLPSPGWPPKGWVMVMCDVGQGDGLVLSTGPHRAVVVDAGPDPEPMDRCLDGLGIDRVPLVLFTHYDADHVDGASAVFSGRSVGAVWTTDVAQPPHGVEVVTSAAHAAGLTPQIAPWGSTRAIGSATIEVLWPRTDLPPPAGTGTATNQASVVLLVRDAGLSLLLTGDLEPESADRIAHEVPGLHVDVLKVPHHGSKYQDEDWLLSLRPEVALTSVGAGNDYGQPAASTLDPLSRAGVRVYRTDRDGSLAVVPSAHGPLVVTHLSRSG